MAVKITRSKAAIESAGGGRTEIIEVTETGANLTVPDTAHDLGFIKDSVFKDKTVVEPLEDETENIIKLKKGLRSTGYSGTLWQSGSGSYSFISDVRNGFFRSYKYETQSGNDHIEIFWATGEFDPSLETKHPDGTMTVEYFGSKVDTSVSFPASSFNCYCGAAYGNVITGISGSLSASNITIPAGEQLVKIATNKNTGLATILGY